MSDPIDEIASLPFGELTEAQRAQWRTARPKAYAKAADAHFKREMISRPRAQRRRERSQERHRRIARFLRMARLRRG